MIRWASLILLLPLIAQASEPIWVGPDCRLSWNHNPPEELVQGYNVHIRGREGLTIALDVNVGYVNETFCSTHDLVQGKYEVFVTAFNPVGVSGPSETLPFVLVTGAPNTPSVTAPSGMTIESAGSI